MKFIAASIAFAKRAKHFVCFRPLSFISSYHLFPRCCSFQICPLSFPFFTHLTVASSGDLGKCCAPDLKCYFFLSHFNGIHVTKKYLKRANNNRPPSTLFASVISLACAPTTSGFEKQLSSVPLLLSCV